MNGVGELGEHRKLHFSTKEMRK